MAEPTYLTLDELIGVHGLTMMRMGSPPSPLLRPEVLDGALNRPRQLAYYQPESDLISQAVVLAMGVSQA